MKTRHIGIALAAFAVAGLWFGRLAWRAHHNLVTLHARNMPLAEVVRSLRWQTWERIRFDKTMNAKITLNVKDAPLSDVLDLVADRAGARWQKTFAVGASGVAMTKLESVLDGAAKLEDAGWTNIAPRFAEFALDRPPGPEPGQIQGRPGQFFQRRLIPNGALAKGGPTEGMGAKMVVIGPEGKAEQWSSERLVLESGLLPLLGAKLPGEATAETAAQAASSVHGRSRLYYALEESPFDMGPMSRRRGPLTGPRKAGLAQGAPGGGVAVDLKQMMQQRRLRELSRSPEEQVERARHQGLMRLETSEESN